MLYRRRSPGVGIQRGKEMKTWLVGLGSAVLVSLLPLVAARAQAVPDPILAGTIDMHIHTEADMMAFGGSSLDDYELAKKARDAGMRAIVIKPIYFESASRAYLVRKLLPGFEVFGGVILNHNVGGMNPAAVDGFARLAGGTKKVVWMPNIDSQRQIEFYKLNRPGVRISNGTQLLPETLSVLDAIARHKLILATSHASAEEALLLIREGRARGIENIVVTHAIQDPINMTVEQMKQAARLGAYIEHTVIGMFKGQQSHLGPFFQRQRRFTIEDHAKAIKAVGAEHCILSTDLGQYFNPTAPDGYKAFVVGLKENGISDAEIDMMARKTPARILGLQP
jgi:Family of unknown function (DUF6282)